MPTETSQTLDRGLRVLRVLAESPEGLTVTELSNRLQVNRTVVYRLISTLEQHGLVRRDARSRLFVGLGVLLVLTGAIWIGQGLGLIPGSVMTGDRTWLYVGIVVVVAGAILLTFGLRRPRPR